MIYESIRTATLCVIVLILPVVPEGLFQLKLIAIYYVIKLQRSDLLLLSRDFTFFPFFSIFFFLPFLKRPFSRVLESSVSSQ